MFQFNDNNVKVLSYRTYMPNMKALSLTVQNIWAMLSFFECRSKVTVKDLCSKFMVPLEGLVIGRHMSYMKTLSLTVRSYGQS